MDGKELGWNLKVSAMDVWRKNKKDLGWFGYINLYLYSAEELDWNCYRYLYNIAG